MKTTEAEMGRSWSGLRSTCVKTCGALVIFLAQAASLEAQIFVVYSGSNTNEGGIASYNLNGTSANPSLVTGLNVSVALTYTNGNLFVVNNASITVGEYTTSGAPVSTTLLTPINYPLVMAASEDGSHLFVGTTDFNSLDGRISSYSSAGSPVTTSLITGLGRLTTIVESGGKLYFANNGPISVFTTGGSEITTNLVPGLSGLALAISGSTLYVSNGNTIGTYTTSGDAINATFITGFPDYITDLAVAGGQLYVMNRQQGTIGLYNLDGSLVNAALVTALPGTVQGFAIAIPEPSTYAAIFGVMALVGVLFRRRRQAA